MCMCTQSAEIYTHVHLYSCMYAQRNIYMQEKATNSSKCFYIMVMLPYVMILFFVFNNPEPNNHIFVQ